MVKVENLFFNYPAKQVLKGISFEIQEGSIVALVGVNGAGKTTLMRCLAALEEPFSGKIFVNGLDTYEQPRLVHRNVGFLPDFFGVYGNLTIKQNLILSAYNQSIPNKLLEEKVLLAAKRLNLDSILDSKAKNLSRGLRQRLAIAQTIIHEPKFLILDEPTSGLDPEARINLSKLFLSLQNQGLTLLVSSHILMELEDYCTDMLIIKDGKLVDYTNKEEKIMNSPYSIEINFSSEELSNNNFKEAIDYLNQDVRTTNLQYQENKISFLFKADKKEISLYMKKFINNYEDVYSFNVREDTLSDIYMRNTKK